MKKIFILAFCALSLASLGQTWEFHQNDTTNFNNDYPVAHVLQLRLTYGRHAATGVPVLEIIEENPFYGLDFRYGWKLYGSKKWHQLFGYPTVGVGLFQSKFYPDTNIVGDPSAAYMFVEAPFKRWKKSYFGYNFTVGMSYDFSPYNPETNPEQTAIGSKHNVHLNAGVLYEFELAKRFDGSVGADLIHWSNGRTRTPNKGMNLFGVNAKLSYLLQDKKRSRPEVKFNGYRPEFIHHEIEKHEPLFEYYISAHGGVCTTDNEIETRDVYYGAGSIKLDAARHYAHIAKYGVGFDAIYDASLQEEYKREGQTPTGKDLWYYGVHASHELMFQKWTFITQFGILVKRVPSKGTWYGRFHLRRDLTEHLWFSGGLKLPDGFRADFIEWGFGYSIYKKKK